MSEEWGPWIEHDGKGCPLPLGTITDEIGVSPLGREARGSGPVRALEVPSWDWSNYGKKLGKITYGKVVRYRIRKPKGLTILEEIAKGIKEPVA